MKTLINRIFIPLFFFILGTIHLQAQGVAVDFTENKGQWQQPIRYKGVLTNGAFFLRNTGFTVVQHNSADLNALSESMHGHLNAGENTPVFEKNAGKKTASDTAAQFLRSHAYNMDFVGAAPNPTIVPDKIQPGYINYFIGNDSTKWASDCKIYQAVTYKDVYPGIDIKYYSESNNLKYEFIVHPGADPGQIAFKFDGVDKLSIKNSELVISTSVGEVRELYPYTYQYVGSERKKIDCRYQLTGNVVRFNINNFSKQSTLVIDPTLIFASLTGSTADNWGYTATYGKDGSFYAGGIVFNTGFPVSPGAYQSRFSGTGVNESLYWNMGIMKFSSNGSQRLFATYIGGGNKDQPHSLFADSQGNLVIAGRTTSDNFPATRTYGTKGGWDIVVAKINVTGTALIGAVRVGGSKDDGFNTADSHSGKQENLINNYGDDARSEVILDGGDNIYVASCTQSDNLYTSPNAVQSKFGGIQDGVLLKVNPSCNTVDYSSYLGGANYDAAFVLAMNNATSDIYVAGGTMSADFPGNKTGSYQATFQRGVSDGFISVFSNDGSVLKQTTFLGTPGTDVIFGIQFDRNFYPYVMGITTGNWPVVNAAYSNPNSKQFISKMKKDLSGFEYSTVFGTGSQSPNISPVAFLVDRCENIYVSGWGQDITGSYNGSPVANMPITADALKKTPDKSDFYFIVIQRNATKLLYGTFYGQNGGFGEHVDGGTSRFDQNGVIYQAICACSGSSNPKPRWPVTLGAWCCSTGQAPVGTGAACNLAALKISFNYAGVGAGVRAYINNVFDTSGCVPLRVVFRDTVQNAKSYEWNFGDGSPVVKTENFEQAHVYNAIGVYKVQMVAVDSTTCNIRDTSYVSIIVRDDQAVLKMNATKLPPCQSLTYQFENNSVAPANKPFHGQSFIWDFGDGTRMPAAALGSITHSYAAAGTYKVRLILADTNYCNSPDSLVTELRVSPLVKAQFELPPLLCAPFVAQFHNTSLAGATFTWDFGDGATSTDINPTHLYATPGTFVVKLKAVDPNTCNLEDVTQMTITVQSSPTASFSASPTTPVENTPIVFTNNSSSNANRFKWQFGDGDSLVTTSRSNIEHQYKITGTFEVCLIAYNQSGCADTVCTTVETIVVPRLDVPNAFTPQGSAPNNRIGIRGFAIGKMRFIIYNRLGQKVFESNNVEIGWDGKFNGVYQPMDVYAYTLEVEFTDGTKASKKGDITLLR